MLKTVFLGTPETAVPFLERLRAKSSVVGVVTNPDQPVGRGYKLTPPPVKEKALQHGLPVLQPEKLRAPEAAAQLKAAWGAVDLGVVVAYGKLIPREIFSLPRFGMVNVHFSLLPKYRGAGPVQWALIRGEKRTGVSLPGFKQAALDVLPGDNSLTLRARLVDLGLGLLEGLLEDLEKRPDTVPVPQSGEPSQAPLLKKEDGLVRWGERTAEEVANLVRGTYEWPGAFSRTRGQAVKFRAGAAAPWNGGRPGEVVSVEKGKGFLVKCREGAYLALRVQPEGKKEMGAADFSNGVRMQPGDLFE
jgi:methionyl-tRNA formyltransferase